MPKPNRYQNPEVLSALVRSGDTGAIAFVAAELKRCGGNLTALAESLGVSRRTTFYWVASVPALESAVRPLIKRKPRSRA
jgi:hypothetical protein